MALKIYGIPRSRAFRTLWMAKELGLDYENVPIGTGGTETRTPDFLKVNPNGHIPAIDDDGSIIWKSMANLYLAEKYGKGTLWPASVEDHGHAYKWSFFGMTEMESHLLTLLNQRVLLPAKNAMQKWRNEFEQHLNGRCPYKSAEALVGSR